MIAECLKRGISIKKICQITNYDLWFVNQLFELVSVEEKIRGKKINKLEYRNLKSDGFSDKRILQLTSMSQKQLTNLRIESKVRPSFRSVDTCAGEFPAKTPYMYSSYVNSNNCKRFEKEINISTKKKVIIIGGGPNRIGQGIEFDYCCVHASFALKELGIESIMINCNPETVSTDFDISDRLYFEPLDEESVLEICIAEREKGTLLGVIVQLGGQTPLKLAKCLDQKGIKILGTSFDSIDLAEDRDRFKKLINNLELNQPNNAIANNFLEAKKHIEIIGFPVVVRPSYVLGGRAMQIIYDSHELKKYFDKEKDHVKSILIDKFLNDAKEIDVDAISDGKETFIAGILEHIEEAGIHSGDSACSLPPQTLSKKNISYIEEITCRIAKKLKIVGYINIQFAIKDNKIYLIEVNPRASRTIPFIAKSIGIPIAKIATKIILGQKIRKLNLKSKITNYVSVKESVFPFDKFPGEDIVLGPEMKSTGEVMGIDQNFPLAFVKSQISSGNNLPQKGTVFLSVKDEDKENIILMSQILQKHNFKLIGTNGTAEFLNKFSVNIDRVNKVAEGSPHIVDKIEGNEIQLIINTTQDSQSLKDSHSIRRAAVRFKIPYFTTISAAKLAITGIGVIKGKKTAVKSLQEYYND